MSPNTLTETYPDWMFSEAKWLAEAIKNWHENGTAIARRYVDNIDHDPAFADFLKSYTPDVPPSEWRRMEKVGRGHLDVRVITGSVRYGAKLEHLPVSEQKALLDDSVPFLLANGDVMQMSIHKIHGEQVKQLLAFDHIRDLGGQRAWIEEQKLLEDKNKKDTTHSVEVEIDGDDFLVDGKAVPRRKLAAYIMTILGR